MPKRVDHRARRGLIADALIRVAAERGLEAVSLREVAAEAGVSSGMVQHYFRTKDDMMLFALEVVEERVRERMETAASHLGPTPSPVALVRALFKELLPVDDRRRVEARVILSFLSYAAVRPRIGEALRKEIAQLLDLLVEGIEAAQDAGDVPADVDPRQAAITLLALMDGLGLHVLTGQYTPNTALSVFDSYADAVLRGRGRAAP